MKKEEKKECYGAFQTKPECQKCPYAESCRYYMLTERKMNCVCDPADVSFETCQEWFADMADFRHIPGCEEEDDGLLSVCHALAAFFRYLLELDDYELGILCEVISPRGGEKGHQTVSVLAKKHGCSRWAMHKKLMKMVGRHPELAGMLQLILFKVSRGRQLFRRSRAKQQMASAAV